MGHTNSTPNIGLPQFIGTDKPTWLGDVNGAMSTIDTKVGSIDAAVATVDAKADNAVADASGAVATATNAATTAGNASTTATQANNLATQALTVANNTADLCTNSIVPSIGTLSQLVTTDKSSLVGAINEVAQSGAQVTVRYYNGYIQYFDGNEWINLINTETPQQILPLMSSNTDTLGTVTCNQTGYENNAYQAIDGGTGSVRMGASDVYVKFSFTNAQYLSSIKCTACSASDASAASDISLEYSIDGNTWTVASTNTIAQNDNTPDVYSGDVNNTVKAIRIHKPDNPGAFILTHIEAYN